jgi:hypothetical protein
MPGNPGNREKVPFTTLQIGEEVYAQMPILGITGTMLLVGGIRLEDSEQRIIATLEHKIPVICRVIAWGVIKVTPEQCTVALRVCANGCRLERDDSIIVVLPPASAHVPATVAA